MFKRLSSNILSRIVLCFVATCFQAYAVEQPLKLEVYHGKSMPFANSALLVSDKSVLLIDSQFQISDARNLIKKIESTGLPLQAILLTHSHPDHAWGAAEISKAYPNAKIYAREPIAQEIDLEFRARLLRWTELLPTEIPAKLYEIDSLEGDTFHFDGHDIEIIDLSPAETIHATAFYLPESKTYISGDQLYNNCHHYIGGGLNRPDLWIESIRSVLRNYSITKVVPGHGDVGGTEIMETSIEYLSFYDSVSKPLVPQPRIMEAMLEKFPGYKMEGVLMMTRGPAITSPELLKKTAGKIHFSDDTSH